MGNILAPDRDNKLKQKTEKISNTDITQKIGLNKHDKRLL